MHLKKTKRRGRVYLSIVQNYRENGKTRTKTIKTIGYADAFSEEFADPIAHFEEEVRKLNEEKKRSLGTVEFSFQPDATIGADQEESARWGSAIALAYLEALDVRSVFSSYRNELPAHTARVFEMFASERIIHAAPKRETWERRGAFPRACNFTLAESYEALQGIAACDRALAQRLRMTYQRIRPHETLDTVYVVLEAFAFADTNDINTAESQDSSEGGLSIGLAMIIDRKGIPAGYRLTSPDPRAGEIGRLVQEVKQGFGARRAVLIAGRLADADAIMSTLFASGDGFILHRALETAVEELQAWATDPQGYTTSRFGNYRIKSRINEFEPPCEASGENAHRLREIVLWGRDYAMQSRMKRDPAHPHGAVDCRDGSQDPHSKDDCASRTDSAGGNSKENASASPSPRKTLQETVESLDGYACIATNEMNLAAREVFHLYRELWRLAEPFQVLESDFSPSPYPIPREDHIRAHFAICYAAFFTMRLMRSDLHWRFNAAQVADALMRMEGSHLAENWFLFSYRSAITDAIEKAAGVDVARKLRTRQDIRRGIAQARKHVVGENGSEKSSEASREPSVGTKNATKRAYVS